MATEYLSRWHVDQARRKARRKARLSLPLTDVETLALTGDALSLQSAAGNGGVIVFTETRRGQDRPR